MEHGPRQLPRRHRHGGGLVRSQRSPACVPTRPRKGFAADAKTLGFAWFYSSESGLFNGLQRFQIRNSLLACLLAAGCPARAQGLRVSNRRPDIDSTDSDFLKEFVRPAVRVPAHASDDSVWTRVILSTSPQSLRPAEASRRLRASRNGKVRTLTRRLRLDLDAPWKFEASIRRRGWKRQ